MNERIKSIIAEIDSYIAELSNEKVDKNMDRRTFHVCSMLLLSIVNNVIKLGEEILSRKSLGVPSSYREIFSILEERGLIGRVLSKDLQEMARLRNRLAHEYGKITKENVIWLTKKMPIVKEFIKITKKVLEK